MTMLQLLKGRCSDPRFFWADIAFMLSQAASKGPNNLRIFDELAIPPGSRTASPARPQK